MPRSKDKGKPEEFFDEILKLVSDGTSLKRACEQVGISRDTFNEHVKKNKDLSDRYACAREERGSSYADKIDDIEQKLLSGEVDSSTARVLIDSLKWKASKFNPQKFGDMMKTQMVDGEGKGINPFDEIYKAICKEKDYVR